MPGPGKRQKCGVFLKTVIPCALCRRGHPSAFSLALLSGKKGYFMFLIHGYLHTMKGAPVADGFIEMQDGHIVSVGPMSELTDVPAGAVD